MYSTCVPNIVALVRSSVADPDTACHFHTDPDPYPACHFDADPDPSIHFDADPGSNFQLDADTGSKFLLSRDMYSWVQYVNFFSSYEDDYSGNFVLLAVHLNRYPDRTASAY